MTQTKIKSKVTKSVVVVSSQALRERAELASQNQFNNTRLNKKSSLLTSVEAALKKCAA